MAQLSRPYQIALVAAAVLGGLLLFALQGRPSSPAGSGSSAAVSTTAPTTAAAEARAAARPTHVLHGSAPGVEGLTRAINKAHHAVAESQQNARRLERKSAQASDGNPTPAHTVTAPGHAPAASATPAAPATGSAVKSASKTSVTAPVRPEHKRAGAPTSRSRAATPSGQRSVEADLAKGDVVLLLFWNPKGADDVAVHRALAPLANEHRLKVAVKAAAASQVGSYGSVTRGVQVFATPTLLVIDKHGHTIVLSGVQDAFSIEQAIDEARQA